MEILVGIWVCFILLCALVHEADSEESWVRNQLDNRRRVKEYRKTKKESWERGIIYDPRTTYQIDIDGLIHWEKQFKLLAGDDYIPAATSLFPEMKPYLAEVVSPIVHDTNQDSHNDVMAVLTGVISKDEYNERKKLKLSKDAEEVNRRNNMYVVDENGAMKAAPKSAQGDHNRYRELVEAHAELQRRIDDSFIPSARPKERKHLPSMDRAIYLDREFAGMRTEDMWPKLTEQLAQFRSSEYDFDVTAAIWSLVDAYGYSAVDSLEDRGTYIGDIITLVEQAEKMQFGHHDKVRWEASVDERRGLGIYDLPIDKYRMHG